MRAEVLDLGLGLERDPTSTSARAAAPHATPPQARRKGRWIDDWEPEDEQFWETRGRRIARKNLALSIFAEHLGFNVWVLWTIVVINLGNAGFSLSLSEQFLLIALPNLVGAALRIPYTFAVPRFGGRAWTTVSAALLLIPTSLLAFVVPSGWLAAQAHGTQILVLALCAATAGLGGGNFSSSMSNISFFYPDRGFVGALIGSLARPLGGLLADRLGGTRVTLAVFLAEALFTVAAIVGVREHRFGLFFGSFMAIFLLAAWATARPTG